jgi:hypothetical protein
VEIGSFLALDLNKTGEYFADSSNLARLNSGRCGIYHSLKILNCSTIYLPYYLCPEVDEFLVKREIKTIKYSINSDFTPVLECNEEDSAVLIVNHFGMLSERKLFKMKKKFVNVIIDNCAAFFSPALPDCFNIYSCRKFFGVPDGCYVIGPNAFSSIEGYPEDQSSETASYLLKRIEKGCSEVYEERMQNESRINKSGIMRMSKLSQSLLCTIDYIGIRRKRYENFKYASKLYESFNLLNLNKFKTNDCIPLFYPLVVKDSDLIKKLQYKKIYTGHRWNSVLSEVTPNSLEAFLSKYMVPIPIDQRYSKSELDYCFKIISEIAEF